MSNEKKEKYPGNSNPNNSVVPLYQNADVLSKMIVCIADVVMSLANCNSLEKLILIDIIIKGGVTEETNGEIGANLKKDAITISKKINALEAKGLIMSSGSSFKRIRAISNSAEPLLYNYRYSILSIYKKEDKNNIIINKMPLAFPIRLNQIQGVVQVVCDQYYMYDPEKICEEFEKMPSEIWLKKIKGSSIGTVIRQQLEQLLEDNLLTLDKGDAEPTYFIQEFTKGLIKLFRYLKLMEPSSIGNQVKVKKNILSDEEMRREKNERSIERYVKKCREEKLIEITSDEQLQRTAIGQIVKVSAYVNGKYVRGWRPMCNYNLVLDNGDSLHAVITNDQYKGREKECEGADEKYIQFEGTVVHNNHLNKRSLKSTYGHFPVKFIKSNDLDTNLNWNNDVEDDLESEEAPF